MNNDSSLAKEDLQVNKNETSKTEFKKPILIGKIGRIPRKLTKQLEERETSQAETHTPSQETELTSSEDQKVADVESEYRDMVQSNLCKLTFLC